MDPSITDVARSLAEAIPTGSEDADQAVQDWRETLYNAKRTKAMRVVSSLVDRCSPEDSPVRDLFRDLARRSG